MKKLISKVMTIALIVSIAGNTFATNGTGGNGANNDNIVLQNITSEQLAKLLEQRSNNSESFRNNDPILLNLKKNALSEGVQNALGNKSSFEVISSKNSSDNYGTIKDSTSGTSFVLKKSSAAELEESSPKKFSHSMALKNATKHAFGPYGKSLGVEGLTFYTGVGANHVFNLLTKYEKNPMALEMFVEELKDPVAQMGFFAFMIGNRYAQTIFQDMMKKSNNAKLKARLTPMLGFLAMGVGSVFSNITHDLITLTKPCATAMVVLNNPDHDTPEKRAAICQEGWNAVMNSDNLARYVTSVMSVVASSVMSAVITQLYKAGTKKTFDLYGITFIFKKIFPSKKPIQGLVNVAGIAGAPVKMGLKGLGIKIVDLVIFLQADEFINPYVHHLVESVGNSAPKLALKRNNIGLLINKLDSNKWEDSIANSCTDAVLNASNNRRDHVPRWIQNDINICHEGLNSLGSFHEKNQKWRDTLSYEFMASYMNWVRFLSEFTVMHEVSREFFKEILFATASKDEDIRTNSDIYNPLAFDNPFYGVLTSENMPVRDAVEYKVENKSKAQRIVESLELVNKALVVVYKHSPNDENVKPLVEVKKLIEIYKKEPVLANQIHLLKAIELINSMNERAVSLDKSMRQSRDRYTNSIEYKYREKVNNKITHIKAIRSYLGNPTPLKKGAEAFFRIFNDYVKNEKPEYAKLFDEKGTPVETITWYAVCGNNLDVKDAKVDRRRTALATGIDSGINGILGASNAVTNWVASAADVKNEFEVRTDVAPALKTFDSINYGTGVDFYVPKIVNGDMKKYCSADGKKASIFSILPDTKKSNLSILGPDGKEYDSLFTYMINNVKPEVLNAARNDNGDIISSGFSVWWDKVITPKIEIAHQGFLKDYNTLLQKSYRKAIDGKLGRNNSNIEGLKEILKDKKSVPWGNASNITQSYIDELNTYLKILDRVYTMTPESNGYAIGKSNEDLKLFRTKLVNIRTMVYTLVNDFRNFNTKGVTWPKFGTNKNGVPYIIEETAPQMDLREKYALLLFEIQGLYAALGFKSEPVIKASKETPYFDKKSGVETVSPMERLMARIQNDETISGHFNTFVDNYDQTTKEPTALTYGLTDSNFKLNKDGVRINPEVQSIDLVNFKSNDRLTIAFITSNQLYALADDIFKTVSILDAATMGANYKDIDQTKQVPQSGSFNR